MLDGSDLPYRDRSPRYRPAGSPVPMDLTVCTRAELDREIGAGNRFIRGILAESIPLYARPEPVVASGEPARGPGSPA